VVALSYAVVCGPKLATWHFLDMDRGALHILLAGLAEIGRITVSIIQLFQQVRRESIR
jgi:hypothetical protein